MTKKYFIVIGLLTGFLLLTHSLLIPRMLSTDFGLNLTNDSLLWRDVASDIISGVKATGRPMFSLILVPLTKLLGDNFAIYPVFFVLVHSFGIAAALFLLRRLRNNPVIVITMAFFAMWEIGFRIPFYTESIAAVVMIIAFSLFLRGFHTFSYNCVLGGLFFMSVAQTMRPWDFVSMFFLPLFPVVHGAFRSSCRGFAGAVSRQGKRWKRNVLLSILSFLAVGAGFTYYMVATPLFCSGRSSEVFPMFVYSQTFGGAGDYVIYREPEVIKAILNDADPHEINKIVLRRAWENFKKNPGRLLRAVRLSWLFYQQALPVTFSLDKIGYLWCPGLLVILFGFYFYDEPLKRLKKWAGRLNWKRVLLWGACAALFFWNTSFFWKSIVVLGIMLLFLFGRRAEKVFFALYAMANLVSLCFMSGQGAGRYWMSTEILLYYSAAFAFAFIAGVLPRSYGSDTGDFEVGGKGFFKNSVIVFLSLAFIFIILPLLIRWNSSSAFRNVPLDISDSQVRKHFNLSSKPIVNPKLMHLLLINWPGPSFEKFNNHFCYYVLRYRGYHGYYRKANEGSMENHSTYWVFSTMPFERVIYLEDRIIFPGTDKSKLSRFEGKEIAVFGRLISRPRKRYVDSGYIIMAKSIAYMDEEGKLSWVNINELK